MLIRKLAKTLHFTVVLLYQAMGQMVICPVAAPLFHRRWVWPRGAASLAAVVVGGLLGFIAQVMLTKGLAREKVGPASALRSTTVLCSFLLQLIVTPEEPVSAVALGARRLCCTTMHVSAGHTCG